MTETPNTIDTAEDTADERASEWVDALMDEREREAFERELAEDPELALELERFEQTVEILRRMPQPAAPDDFLKAVQSRIRRRSRGRWYGFEQAKTRFPYEAAFNIVLIGILFALYLSSSNWATPSKLVKPKWTPTAAKQVSEAVPTEAIIGAPVVVNKTEAGTLLDLTVKAGAFESVKKVIDTNPALEFISQTAGDKGSTVVRVRYQDRGPPSP